MTTTQILYPPLAAITPVDQRGVLWVIGIISLAFIYLTLALRVFVRWRRFQPDDYAILAACVLVIAEASVAFAAVGMGLGTSKLNREGSREGTVWKVSCHSCTTRSPIIFVFCQLILGFHSFSSRAKQSL